MSGNTGSPLWTGHSGLSTQLYYRHLAFLHVNINCKISNLWSKFRLLFAKFQHFSWIKNLNKKKSLKLFSLLAVTSIWIKFYSDCIYCSRAVGGTTAKQIRQRCRCCGATDVRLEKWTIGLPVHIRLFSPRSSESAWGRWEKDVPLYTWSSSFSFTCVMVSQSSTLEGSGWVSFTPPPWTRTFKVCQGENRGRWSWEDKETFGVRNSLDVDENESEVVSSPGFCTPRPPAAGGCHSRCTWPCRSQRLLGLYPPGALWPWTACKETPLPSPAQRQRENETAWSLTQPKGILHKTGSIFPTIVFPNIHLVFALDFFILQQEAFLLLTLHLSAVSSPLINKTLYWTAPGQLCGGYFQTLQQLFTQRSCAVRLSTDPKESIEADGHPVSQQLLHHCLCSALKKKKKRKKEEKVSMSAKHLEKPLWFLSHMEGSMKSFISPKFPIFSTSIYWIPGFSTSKVNLSWECVGCSLWFYFPTK